MSLTGTRFIQVRAIGMHLRLRRHLNIYGALQLKSSFMWCGRYWSWLLGDLDVLVP